MLAAILAMVLADHAGWRGLFWVGALPLVTLLPLALLRMPESPQWLATRGRLADTEAVSARTGIPVVPARPVATTAPAAAEKVGFAVLASRRFAGPTLLLGVMSFVGLLLTYVAGPR